MLFPNPTKYSSKMNHKMIIMLDLVKYYDLGIWNFGVLTDLVIIFAIIFAISSSKVIANKIKIKYN